MSDDEDFLDFDVDFANVKPMPVGDCTAVISDAQVTKTAKAKENDTQERNLILTYEILEPVESSGKTIKEWIYIDPSDPWSFLAAAEELLGTSLEGQSINLRQIVDDLQGQTVGLTLTESTYNGKPQAKVAARWRQ